MEQGLEGAQEQGVPTLPVFGILLLILTTIQPSSRKVMGTISQGWGAWSNQITPTVPTPAMNCG